MFALLATVFLVAEIFSDSFYSIYLLLFFRLNNNHDVCISVFLLLWLTSYYAILAYCVLCAIIWVGGVDVCNVDCPLFVCVCFVDTPVCVPHAGCRNDK